MDDTQLCVGVLSTQIWKMGTEYEALVENLIDRNFPNRIPKGIEGKIRNTSLKS
jgi:hypothetical protein